MSSILENTHDYTLILPYVTRIFPLVDRELNVWLAKASTIPDPELRKQALASIDKKRFHCQGGSIYALYTREKSTELIHFIVALQTISDYLDNLCDRVPGASEESFRRLHQAILAAVDIEETCQDWYEHYPFCNDGGYLKQLVARTRETLVRLPGYQDVRTTLRSLLQLYVDLQVYKHIEEPLRVERLVHWYSQNHSLASDVYWWEFSAASGSTLAVFLLTAMAAAGPVSKSEIEQVLACYFPWLCGFHILLDYFIDLDEDQQHHDLNFVDCYPTPLVAERGLLNFLSAALQKTAALHRPAFHRTVVYGLLALYLSDPKANVPERKKLSQQLLRTGGNEALWLHRCCLLLRKLGKI
ncbi:MAG TPA: tetraprenyl-beta-curcumene synthase family protein [Oscillospiraceae bacterium]|nr:tetraprenyl-beta-curcumene synthase family protein [Oscillospiraceae bacterium]